MTQPMSDEDWRVFDILCGQKVNGHDYIIWLIKRVVIFLYGLRGYRAGYANIIKVWGSFTPSSSYFSLGKYFWWSDQGPERAKWKYTTITGALSFRDVRFRRSGSLFLKKNYLQICLAAFQRLKAENINRLVKSL